MHIKKGTIVLASFDPSVGHEIRKTRPALIIQNNIACNYSNLFTLIPFSSKEYTAKVFELFLRRNKQNKLTKDSVLLVNKIMTFDKSRIVKILGEVDEEFLNEVYEKIDIHFGRL